MKSTLTKVLSQQSLAFRATCIASTTLGIFLAPLKTEKVMVKTFSRGLNIQTAKSEPPRIAFSEVKNYLDSMSPARLNTNSRNIYDNRPSVNLNETLEQNRGTNTVTQIRAKRVQLKAMLISRTEILNELQMAKSETLPQPEREMASVLKDMNSVQSHQKTLSNSLAEDSLSWIDTLSAPQKNRLLTAQQKNAVLDQDWQAKTLQEALKEQISQESQQQRSAVTSNSPAGTVIISSKSTNQGSAKNIVSGEVLLQPGLALADGYVDIRHVKSGVALSAGKLKLPSNKYSIEVSEPTGQIVATLYGGRGQKLGEGKIKVAQVDRAHPKAGLITINPIYTGFTTSSHDFGQKVAALAKNKDYGDRGVKTQAYFPTLDLEVNSDDQGVTKVDNVIQDSWGLVRTEAEGYAPALDLISAGPEKKKTVFKKKFIEALLSIAKDQQRKSEFEETNSVIWGQAILDGKPQAGVQVDVEFAEKYKPIYFNQFMIPDPSLRATSDNGYYAILHLPEGFHSLVATRGNQYFSHANVQAEPGTVFVANLETTLTIEKVELKVFDAFSGVPSQAEIELQSLPEPVRADGYAEIYLHEIDRMSLMKVAPADPKYISQVQIYSDAGEDLKVGLIESEWLQNLQNQRRISAFPETSTIIGFVSDENYEVYLPHDEKYSPHNIIYFDANGSPVSSGVPGGGFVMYNVPLGTHSVVVAAKSTNAIHAQVIPVDLGVSSVLYFHF